MQLQPGNSVPGGIPMAVLNKGGGQGAGAAGVKFREQRKKLATTILSKSTGKVNGRDEKGVVNNLVVCEVIAKAMGVPVKDVTGDQMWLRQLRRELGFPQPPRGGFRTELQRQGARARGKMQQDKKKPEPKPEPEEDTQKPVMISEEVVKKTAMKLAEFEEGLDKLGAMLAKLCLAYGKVEAGQLYWKNEKAREVAVFYLPRAEAASYEIELEDKDLEE